MSRIGKKWLTAGAIAMVVLAGILLGWLASSGPEIKPAASAFPSAEASSPLPQVAESDSTSAGVATSPDRPSPSAGNKASQQPPAVSAKLDAGWEEAIDQILQADTSESAKAQQILKLFRSLPARGQEEAAQHLSNLVQDADYAPMGRLLADAKLPEPVLDVLVADALNRPNSVKLPLMLEVARNADHPKADEARELLQLYLEADLGTDWPKWQARLDLWLKENPD